MSNGFLSAEELTHLTGTERVSVQEAWLRAEGVPYRRLGAGPLVVCWVHVHAWIERTPVAEKTTPPQGKAALKTARRQSKKRPTVTGELNPNASIPDAAVKEIRSLREAGISLGALAKRFDRPKSTIQALCDGSRRATPTPNVIEFPIGGVDEKVAAQALSLSVGWLRKDRYGKRTIPFFRLGGRIRYDLERIRASLAAREEGKVLKTTVRGNAK